MINTSKCELLSLTLYQVHILRTVVDQSWGEIAVSYINTISFHYYFNIVIAFIAFYRSLKEGYTVFFKSLWGWD